MPVPQRGGPPHQLVEEEAEEIQRHPEPAEKLRLHRHGDDEEREEGHRLVGVIAAIQREEARHGGQGPKERPVDPQSVGGAPRQRADRDASRIDPGKPSRANQVPHAAAEEIQPEQIEEQHEHPAGVAGGVLQEIVADECPELLPVQHGVSRQPEPAVVRPLVEPALRDQLQQEERGENGHQPFHRIEPGTAVGFPHIMPVGEHPAEN